MKNKKLIIFFIIVASCFAFFPFTQLCTLPKANSNIYAKIIYNNTYLYKTPQPNEALENKWCLLTSSFFVKVTTSYNENYFKVSYGNLNGFVKKNEVQLVNETPNMPYPQSYNFTITHPDGCHFRTSPKIKPAISNITQTLPRGTTLTFLGKIIGDEAIDNQGSVWYLASHNGEIGYVYSYYSTTFLPSQTNDEITTKKLSLQSQTLNPLTNTTSLILLGALMLPVILMLTLLYRPRPQKVCAPKPDKHPSNMRDTTNHFHNDEL